MPDEGDIAQEKYERFLEARIAEHRYRHNAPNPPPSAPPLQRGIKGDLRGGAIRCVDCEDVIPEARLKAAPRCQRCIDCQKAFEEGENDV